MSQLQEFDLIFFKGSSLISKLIKYFTESSYSHVAIVIDQFHMLETDYKFPLGIRHTSYATSDYDVYRLKYPLNDAQKRKLLNFVHEELNKKYDWGYILSRLVNKLFGTKIYHSDTRYNCDEFVVDLYKQIGVELVDSKTGLSPEKLRNSEWLVKVE